MKSLMNKKRWFNGFIVIAFSVLMSSCAVQREHLKCDIIGFNDDITHSYTFGKCMVKKLRKQSEPYDLQSDIKQATSFVEGIPQGKNTSAYYALDNALDRVEYVQKKYMDKDPNSKYYVVMLTDGLDNYSGHKAREDNKWKYRKQDDASIAREYKEKLPARMEDIMKTYKFFNLIKKPNTTNSFQSYVLLYKGDDIKESNYSDKQLKELLQPFTGGQNAEKPEPIISENFEDLFIELERNIVSRSFGFLINKQYEGRRIRMKLDTEGTVYFEGDFVKEDKYYYFENVKLSDGLKVKKDRLYGFTNPNSGGVTFYLEDLKLNGFPYKVDNNSVTQWYFDMGDFRRNAEYSKRGFSAKNTYMILLVDGSESFKEKIKDAKKMVIKIINMVTGL